MITETRKQIIELIEPYMETEFWFGCLVRNKFTWEISINQLEELDPIYLMEIEIIWYYDITAVLKYIFNSMKVDFYFLNLTPDWEQMHIKIKLSWNHHNKEIVIPNKPLNLYTEEENKNLFELLQKLWQ